MNTRLILLFLFFGCAALSLAQQKPNIVFYLADDLGYKDVGFNGAKVVQTPNLDKLAGEGMVFENVFIASPACAPSRGALLTGLYPARNGAEANHTYPRPDVEVLTRRLQQNGYKIYAFGKVAHGAMNQKCGFDFYHSEKVNLAKNVKAFFAKTPVDGPVCLLVGDRRPHVAWTPNSIYDAGEVDLPPYFIDTPPTREHRARYYSDVTGFDKTFGEILAFADSLLGENTLVMVSSDHGAQWPFGKWNLYDAGIRTPLVVRWPGKVEAGSRTAAMVSWVDILPTLLELSGSQTPEDLDGKSFAKVLIGESNEFRQVIFTTHSGDGVFNVYPIRSVRTARYKYIRNLLPDCYHTNHSDLLRKDRAGAYWDSWDEAAKTDKRAAEIISKYYRRPAEEFYDLQSDPDEQHNLIDQLELQQKIYEMRKLLDDWMEEQGDRQTVFQTPYPLSKPKPDKALIERLKNNQTMSKNIEGNRF